MPEQSERPGGVDVEAIRKRYAAGSIHIVAPDGRTRTEHIRAVDDCTALLAEIDSLRALVDDVRREIGTVVSVGERTGGLPADQKSMLNKWAATLSRVSRPQPTDTPSTEPSIPQDIERAVLRALGTVPSEPTPESIRALAEWFDDPNKSPAFAVDTGLGLRTPGYLLRVIADALAEATHPEGEPR